MSSKNWSIKSLNGSILWLSSSSNSDTPDITTILNKDMNDEEIQYITAQIIRNASYKSIGFLLTCISCNTWRNDENVIDPMKINSLKNAQPKTICGKVFRKGDIVWSCRSCAKDLTCVQCDDCFRNSNHHNHEVYFHRESEKEGGCCDCGDPSAWSKLGNCTKHNHEIDPNLDPLCIIPDELMKSLKPVLIAISGILASYVTCITRGYQKLDENEFLNNFISNNEDDKLVIRLHNDDIHTYDEVTNALQAAGLNAEQAKNFTVLVDKAGEAAVYTIEGKKDSDVRKWNKFYEELSVKAGLLFSIIPESIYIMGPKITAVITWLQSIGNMNDGLRRLISNSLIINVNDLPDCLSAYPTISSFNPRNLFSESSKNKFPNEIQHLAKPGADDFLKLDEYPFDLALHPFKTCHKNCLSLMIAASPYLGKSVKKALNDIVLIYQHDKIFKSSYSQSLTALYPTIYFLLSKSVGTMENTIFNTTVQVYTCKTIVNTMSSDGITQRVLRDTPVNEGGTEIHITKVLSSILRNSFNTITFLAREEDMQNTYHLRLRNYSSALHQACRDFEYCVEDPVDAIRILSGQRDPGVIDDLLVVYASLNCIENFKRRGVRELHVERDSDKWQEYWKIIGEMDSISTKLVNSAFFTQIPKHNVSESLILQAESEYDRHLSEALHQVVGKTLQNLNQWTSSFEAPLDQQYFRSKTESLNCLGHPILFRAYQRYQVSNSPVSIHIPLHRFLTKIITFACYGGVDLTSSLKVFLEYPDAVDSLADYPLRCLSFVAQVNSDMWRKNGLATANIAYFYQMSPYVKFYRDIDIHAVQIAMAVAGPDSVLALALDRFEVLTLLESTDYNNVVDPIKGSKGTLLAHLLRTLIHIVTQPPYILERIRNQNNIDPFDDEGVERSVKSEVCHFLLGGAKNISSFSKLRGLVGSDTTITDDLINNAINELCIKREMGDDRISLEPKDCAFELFDPEFSHLSHKQSQVALETVKAYRKKVVELKKSNGKEDNDIIPIVTPSSIKKPHPQLLCVRTFLYRPFTFTMLERCMNLTLESVRTSLSLSSSSSSGNFCAIISKIIHLVTLQIHCYPDFKRELCRGTSCYTSEKYFNRSSGSATTGTSVAQDVKEIERNIEIEKKFVFTLADVFLSGIARTEDIYESGLKWVLRELSTYNEVVRDLLLAKNITFKSSVDENMEKRKNSAKERLSAKMKRQADSFSKLIENMSDDEDDEMQEDNDVQDDAKEVIPTCIVCHTTTAENVGYLSFLQSSSVLQQTLTLNDDYQNQIMNSIYRVVALRGCDILKSNVDNASVKHHLQQGEHILVSSQVGKWVKVVAPVQGWVAMYCNPMEQDNNDGVVAQLYPVKDLQFNRFGRNRVHVSSCGHCMHRSCWETYHAMTLSNVWNSNFGRMAIDVEKNELLCPLCKGITNSFLPVTPVASIRDSIAASTASSDITTLSNKLSTSYNWSQIGEELVTMPSLHSVSNHDDSKRFVDDCLNQSVPQWINESEKSEYTAIDVIATNRKISNIRCIQSGWTATAYAIMSATCNGRWIDSKQGNFLISDSHSIDMSMITQMIISLRKSSNWFDSLNDFNDFVLNPLQRLLSGSLSSVLIENFSSEESIASLKGFHLIDASSCTIQDCYSTLLRLPSYTVPHASLIPDMRRMSFMLALFHKKGVQDKYLWNFLHIPLLSHDLHVVAVAITSYTPSLQSLEEGIGLLVLARLVQIMLEPTVLGFFSVDKNLKRERSDTPKTASLTNESKLLIDLKVHVCTQCKIPTPTATTHEDELTEHILKLWLHYLEYSCAIGYIATKIFEPRKQIREKYLNALNSSDTMIARVNSILDVFNLPSFHELLSSNGLFELATQWSQQFLSTSPESLDSQTVQEINPIIPTPIQVASKQDSGSTSSTMDIDQLAASSLISSLRPNDNDNDGIVVYSGLVGNENGGEEDEEELMVGDLDVEINTDDDDDNNNNNNNDDDDDEAMENNEMGIGGNMQALLQSILGGMQQANAYANIGSDASAKWKLTGVFPTNRIVDEILPGMFKLPNPNESQTLASFHSSTPLLGSISGTHVINGVNGERLEHVFPDISHMAISINHCGGLIKLPPLYTDLYQMAKFPEGSNGIILDDPAVCLICGRICNAGNRKSQDNTRMNLDPGEATLHARECGSGVGVFFLAHKGTVLLLRGSRAIYYPSVYVDQNGESGEGLHNNRPLFLSAKKYRKLEELYLKHQIGTEVTRNRSTADKNIRLNWY